MITQKIPAKFNTGVIIMLLSMAVITSCKKNLLETVPTTRISEVNAFSTPEKILAQVNNLYSKIQTASFYGGRLILFNEQRGEEFSQNDGNAAVGALIWQQNPLSTSDLVSGLWNAAYTAINATNIFITQVGNTEIINASLRDQYIGEAKFIRALSYLSLVQTFAKPYLADNGASAGVPLRLKAETSEGNNDLARSSVGQVYTQIISDLNDAVNSLPAAYTTAALNASRAYKSTAIALLTRAYLIKGDYENVVKEASKIVPPAVPFQYTSTGVTHKLEANVATVFGGSYTGSEAIFFLPFNAADAPGIQSSLAASYYGSIVVSLNASGIVSNAALSSATSTDARKNFVVTKNGQKVLAKFLKIVTPYTDYIPVIRYAEVLLNYAEAAARTNNTALASALLKAIRQRSDPNFSFPASDMASQSSLVNSILTERRIELLGEGFRTPDLQRQVQTLPAKSGAIGSAPAVVPMANNYIWPIPTDEIASNKLCVPNP